MVVASPLGVADLHDPATEVSEHRGRHVAGVRPRVVGMDVSVRSLEIAKEQNKPEKVAEATTCLAELRSGR